MIGGVTRLGRLPGLPGRVTLSAGVAFCHLNDSRWGSPPSLGRVHVTVNCLWRRLCIIKSDSKKQQHQNVDARADNETKRTLTTKMRHLPVIFSVYMPSDQATTSSNVTPGPRGCKFACKRGPFFDHVNRPLVVLLLPQPQAGLKHIFWFRIHCSSYCLTVRSLLLFAITWHFCICSFCTCSFT